MILDLQKVLNSSLSLRLVSRLAQSLPPSVGYRVAHLFADQIARRRGSPVVRALRTNQWVAGGETLTRAALDQAVRETLRTSARSLFDVYHYGQNLEALRTRIVFDSSFLGIAGRAEFEDRGLMIAGLHMSAFDLAMQRLYQNGLKPLVLTLPDPKGGRRVEYEMRRRLGMNLLPASVTSLRQGLNHLQKGGMVLTGIDRPVEEPRVQPYFFGRPAALPVYPVFLAVKTRVPVIVAATFFRPDGTYHLFASEPIEMDACPDPSEAIVHNAEKVLAAAEVFIRRSPHEWSVPLPVWPQRMAEVPE